MSICYELFKLSHVCSFILNLQELTLDELEFELVEEEVTSESRAQPRSNPGAVNTRTLTVSLSGGAIDHTLVNL